VHRLSARLLGFPTAIVHGMWTKARCLAALDPRLGDKFTVEVTFRKPILRRRSCCSRKPPARAASGSPFAAQRRARTWTAR
jgi:hypothetical protein